MAHYNLFGVSGQSNAEGYRSDPGYLDSTAPNSLIPFNTNITDFDTQVGWGGATGMTNGVVMDNDALIPLQPKLVTDGGGSGWTENVTVPSGKSSWGYGPEMTFATTMRQTGFEVGIMKRCGSGQPLGDIGGTGGTYDYYHNPQAPADEAHLRDADGNTPGRIGLNVYNAIQRMQGMQSALAALGHTSSVNGWIWWHGHADSTVEAAADRYSYELRRLILFTRAYLGSRIPFIVPLHYSSATYAANTRDSMAEIARTVKGVYLYDPSYLSLYSDGIHYWEDAHVRSGIDIANIAIEAGMRNV